MNSRGSTAPSNLRQIAPALLTASRLFLLPGIWFLWVQGHAAFAVLLFVLAVITDWADGWLARHLGVASTFGAFFDAITDIVFLVSLLVLLGVGGQVPLWLFVAPLAAAATFLLTSKRTGLRYDPVGKHFGGILYVIGGCLLCRPSSRLCVALCVLVVILSLVVLTNRLISCRSAAHWRK